jgi:hypothetical protein
VLLRYVDSPSDLSRLAELSEATGNRTRHALATLGKSRTFRLLRGISKLGLATIALLLALSGQLATLASALLQRLVHPPRHQLR